MKKFMQELKEFAMRGNVVDLAIGVIIGGAFSSITASLINDLVMPVIGMFLGGIDFSTFVVMLPNFYGGDPTPMNVGLFIQTVINFVILAVVVFFLVKAINKLRKKSEEIPAEPPATPEPTNEEKLLAEILETLKKNGANS